MQQIVRCLTLTSFVFIFATSAMQQEKHGNDLAAMAQAAGIDGQNKFDEAFIDLLIQEAPGCLKNYLKLSPDAFSECFPYASLFIGRPGVGKSTLAQAIAVKYGFNLEFIRAR